MDQAVVFRKTSNDLLGKVRHEMQAPSREDIDTIMLAVRHMEKRLLDRIEQLGAHTNGSTVRKARVKKAPSASKAAAKKRTVASRTEAEPMNGGVRHD
jgi:hypothetical protein